METKRTVWRTPRAGSLRRLAMAEEPMPPLPPDAIRVAAQAIGLNFADIFAVLGLYSAAPKGAFIPGLEFAGVVTETGSGAAGGFAPGDRVMGVTRFGGYATYIDVEPAYCQRLPGRWTFAEGAAFPVQTMTAWYALKTLGGVRPGQQVLVHSAAGGVGLQALALCAKLGARAIGTVGSEAKRAFLAGRGFDRVVVRGRGPLRDAVRDALAGEPLHLVLDAIGGRVQRDSYSLLAPTGRLVVFGAAEFMGRGNRPDYLGLLWRALRHPRYNPLHMIAKNRSVMAFNLIWLWNDRPLLSRLMEELNALELESPYVGRAFPFEEAPAALAHLQSGQSIGKVVLSIETPSS